MFIPIIIPIYRHDDDDYYGRHGKGCRCPECIKKEERDNMPREYYKYRYAIPKSFVIKNSLFKILRFVFLIIGLLLVISPITFLDISIRNHFLFIILPVVIGFLIAICGFIGMDVLIKEPYECKDKIHLKADYFASKEDWDNLIKQNNIPKNYILTEIKTDWRYK